MLIFLLCLASTLASAYSVPFHSDLRADINSPECKEWVDSVYNSLSERERVAQLVVAHLSPAMGQSSRSAIKQMVKDNKVGGILFSKGSLDEYASMINYAQSLADVPLMMTLDGEWGIAMRVKEAPRFPYNMGLGAITDHNLLYEYGKEMARECKALGLQVNFAPVLDVNSNPANPVIGYRSYGEDPERVAMLGLAYSVGMENGGVMSVAKHFPGHGNTNADSHKTLPVLNQDFGTLKKIDLYPFKKYIASGCSGVMVGHIAVPSVDSTGYPASMSHKITTDLLQDKMGFNGLVFTDGLGMEGAKVNGNICVSALKAGADVLLGPLNVSGDIDAVIKAINSGELSKQDIEDKCKKMLTYKYLLGLDNLATIDEANIYDILNSPEADDVNRRLADAMITAVHNNGGVLPIGNLGHNRIAVVNIGLHNDNEFDRMCRQYADVDVYNGNDLDEKTLARIREHDTVIAAVFEDSQASRSAFSKLKGAQAFIPVFMIHPYKMSKYRENLANASAIVIAYDDTPYALEAAAKGLFGGIEVSGRLPVNVSGVAEMGAGVDLPKTRLGFSSPLAVGLNPEMTAKIDSLMVDAMAQGAFPGAQLLIAKNGDVVVERSYGLTTKGGKKVGASTLYDLASVSKAVGTLPGIMKAYDHGLIDLDQPVRQQIAGMNVEGKDSITPRMLLYHESGMPPSLNLFTVMMDTDTYSGALTSSKRDKKHTVKIYNRFWGNPYAKMRNDIAARHKDEKFDVEAAKGVYVGKATYDTIMNRIYNASIKPDRKYRYSCLNFCLLMNLEQNVTHQPHQQWVADSVWSPIGAYGFCYRPYERGNVSDIAATENDVYLRKQHLQGYVHDELAAFSGGVQGNAGVFGSAMDVAKLCQTWLNGGWYGDARVFSDETNRMFTTNKSPNSRRGLGFDKPDVENPENSPTCDEAGASVFGHTGFTGTAFWVDPDNDMIFIFLSNRVDPTRDNAAWAKSQVRSNVMSLLYNSIL